MATAKPVVVIDTSILCVWLKKLAEEWPPLAAQKMSIGDTTIKEVADYYAAMGCRVVLLTGDQQLAAHQPPPPKLIPRRRK